MEYGDNLCEMLNPNFWEEKKNVIIFFSSAELAYRM